MTKTKIKNCKDLDIVLSVKISQPQEGLVFILHGLGGFKEQEHIQAFAQAFTYNNFTIVNIDATNSIGESGGRFEDATLTNYYHDLEDVIAWAKSESWYQEPFALAGHSLGAISVALYAENNPEKVIALAPISVVVSGKLSWEAHQKYKPEEFARWQKTGWLKKESVSKPGFIKKLPWSHMEDRLKYNLFDKIKNLKMPIILIVGERDVSTPVDQHIKFYEKLPAKKEMHIIEGVEHSFRNEKGLYDDKILKRVKQLISDWIKKWH